MEVSIVLLISSITLFVGYLIGKKEGLSSGYTTEASFQDLQDNVSAELSSINSSIQFGNLLSGIQTYQLHKITKRGDNLLK